MRIFADKAIPALESNLLRILKHDEFSLTLFSDDQFETLNQDTIDVLLIRSPTKINQNTLTNHKIKFIGSATAGIDHLDTVFLDDLGIKWAHAPGCNAWSVVHYVMSALEVIYQEGLGTVSNGVGIIGYGNIGKRLATTLETLKIPFSIYDPYLLDLKKYSLEKVFNHDVITLHVPLTQKGAYPTFHMIDSNELGVLKNKNLINTSRGGVINEAVISNEHYINLVLDVWESEPTVQEEYFNTVFLYTPHIAGYSLDGKENGTKIITERLGIFLGRSLDTRHFETERKFFNAEEIVAFQREYHASSFPRGFFSAQLNLSNQMQAFKLLHQAGNSLSKIRSKHLPRRDFNNYSISGKNLNELELLSKLTLLPKTSMKEPGC